MAFLTLPLQVGVAFATAETDTQIAILKTGSLSQKIAFLSSIPVCGLLPQEYQATIKATARDEKQVDAVRMLAAVALCGVPSAYAFILPFLAFGSDDLKIAASTRSAALTVIKHIAVKAIEAKETGLLSPLEKAREQVSASKAAGAVEGSEIDACVEKIDESIRYLQSVSEAAFKNLALRFVNEHPRALALGGAYLLLLVALLALSVASPRRIIVIDEALQKLSIKLPDWVGGLSISPRYLLLANLLVRSGRVLDHWIVANLPAARRGFERTAIFRAPVAATTLMIDGTPADAAQASIRHLLESGTRRIMILGTHDTRVGLLAQIARWCFAGDLLPKAAFPLWLDRDLLASCKNRDELFEKSKNLFNLSIDTQISGDFFSLLISKRRIVLFVVDLCKADTRVMTDLMAAAFPSEACLFVGTDETPRELLITFAQVKVTAAPAST
jgi:hypothetical protein